MFRRSGYSVFLMGMAFLCCGCSDEAALREANAGRKAAEDRTAVAEKQVKAAEELAEAAQQRAVEAEKRSAEADKRAKAAAQKATDAELFVKMVGKWAFEKSDPRWSELILAPDGKARGKDDRGQSYTGWWKAANGRLIGVLSDTKGGKQTLNRTVSFNGKGDLQLWWLGIDDDLGPDRFRRVDPKNPNVSD
jgi:nucleoid-associated protein YgaU